MMQSKESLAKRARAKYLSCNLATRLLEHNPSSSLRNSYGATMECNGVLIQTGQRITGTYCKNRWCALCNRIRTAKLINGYEPVLTGAKGLKSPYFVTLTKQTVTATALASSIKLMGKTWSRILDSRENRKRKIRGVRKAECTVRPNGHYHYHFHVIVDGKENAEWLVSEWLLAMGNLASEKAQDIRIADTKSLKELFKYFTKLTAKGDGTLIEYKRMDVIFTALRGKRVYQPFGGIHPVSEDIEEIQSVVYDTLEYYEQIWVWDVNDWINEYGECLTGYKPNKRFETLFEQKILPET